jgi:hypothetical protein
MASINHDRHVGQTHEETTMTTHRKIGNVLPERQEIKPDRANRSRRRRVTVALVAITTTLVTLTSASPAAAVVTFRDTSCSQGSVLTTVDVHAGQYVSLQFKFASPAYGTSYSAWQTPFWAPNPGSARQFSTFYPGWRGATAVYVRVAYWNGSRWYYFSQFEPIEQDAWSCIV